MAATVSAVAVGAVCVPFASAADKVKLSVSAHPRHRQITTKLVVEGSLVTSEKEGKERKLPIRIDGELDFVDDTRLQGGKSNGKSLRFYRTAVGKIDVNDQVDRLQISPNRQLIAVNRSAEMLQLTSPAGPLTRADLELLEMQFDVAVLDGLIPGEGISKQDSWEISAALAAQLLGLDSAEVSKLKATATELTTERATIAIAGDVEGIADGAKAKISVEGTVTFDRRASQFSAVQINFSEVREASPTAPGFELKSKLTTKVATIASPKELLTKEARDVAARWAPATGAIEQLDFASAASEIGIVHDRTWHVTSHRRELIVLRKMDAGAQIAQCNITRLPLASGDKALELKQFEEQVQKALGENFGRIDEASQATAEGDLEILRIAASGQVNEVPITWIYFHLAAKDGRRAVLVFTLTSDNVERFATSDHDLIGGFRFLEAKTPEQAARPSGAGEQR